MKYIISVKHPARPWEKHSKNKQTYVSELKSNFEISCSSSIKNAYRFDNFATAWMVAKFKHDSYHKNGCEVKVLKIGASSEYVYLKINGNIFRLLADDYYNKSDNPSIFEVMVWKDDFSYEFKSNELSNNILDNYEIYEFEPQYDVEEMANSVIAEIQGAEVE